MSTDLSDFYAEKRRDRAESAEQARKDKAAEAQLRRDEAATAAELKRQDAKAAAELKRQERREVEQRKKREKAERLARRQQRIESARTWLAEESDTAFSIAMIVLAVVPAIISQVGALDGKTDTGSAVSLALMLELGAWSATVGASRAMRDGRPVTPYRLAMWGCAAVAAAINVSHNGGLGSWFGWVMGAASLAGVGFWELRCVGRHGTSRRTKAQRVEDKQRARHTKMRRKHFPDLWTLADRILADAEFGSITQEQAWEQAREVYHGTTKPGMTPAVVAMRSVTRRRMEQALAVDGEADPLFPDTVPDDLLRQFRGTYGTVYRSPLNGDEDGDDGPTGLSVQGVPAKPSGGPSEAAETLGGKGKRALRRLAQKGDSRPLDEADLARVRLLAEGLGGKGKLSARNVREAIGCRNDYAIRLRDAIKNEDVEQ
ncbi:hypothetical protein [Kitasatospora sp. NPDC002965]|uniref:hypothetical protein n=1 Tax=Kitasatospora sp. NPDC002965 TaxID=3154775 RepID=UPI0033BA1260